MTALVVLVAALAVCVAGSRAVDRAVSEANDLLAEAVHASALGDAGRAMAHMRALDAGWRGRGRALELLTSHDALGEVQAAIADAGLCLESGQRDEFVRACASASVLLERLRLAESLRLVNVF